MAVNPGPPRLCPRPGPITQGPARCCLRIARPACRGKCLRLRRSLCLGGEVSYRRMAPTRIGPAGGPRITAAERRLNSGRGSSIVGGEAHSEAVDESLRACAGAVDGVIGSQASRIPLHDVEIELHFAIGIEEPVQSQGITKEGSAAYAFL